eukprot:CAMPEP_0114554344 /NCGR_PEP_ID=MMETSP0114-20121206/8163_1 /TAXON_ID=31324 /ORGANISM="Goniomonas sp, Strain m" /LENGTH=333 /DNA_ID=CAMNT_0001739391 /DNA_START=35 /DNA_END=1037 /DNA_ORIENTATION=-
MASVVEVLDSSDECLSLRTTPTHSQEPIAPASWPDWKLTVVAKNGNSHPRLHFSVLDCRAGKIPIVLKEDGVFFDLKQLLSQFVPPSRQAFFTPEGEELRFAPWDQVAAYVRPGSLLLLRDKLEMVAKPGRQPVSAVSSRQLSQVARSSTLISSSTSRWRRAAACVVVLSLTLALHACRICRCANRMCYRAGRRVCLVTRRTLTTVFRPIVFLVVVYFMSPRFSKPSRKRYAPRHKRITAPVVSLDQKMERGAVTVEPRGNVAKSNTEKGNAALAEYAARALVLDVANDTNLGSVSWSVGDVVPNLISLDSVPLRLAASAVEVVLVSLNPKRI